MGLREWAFVLNSEWQFSILYSIIQYHDQLSKLTEHQLQLEMCGPVGETFECYRFAEYKNQCYLCVMNLGGGELTQFFLNEWIPKGIHYMKPFQKPNDWGKKSNILVDYKPSMFNGTLPDNVKACIQQYQTKCLHESQDCMN